MMKNSNDIGFIHDISSLDKLRQQAVGGEKQHEQAALEAAARQFESIFTSMLFKSMREANSGFESELMNSQNQTFYRQMLDEQMASELSSSGSLGLADMIVKQLSASQGNSANSEDSSAAGERELAIREAARDASASRLFGDGRVDETKARDIERRLLESGELTKGEPAHFDSPESFIATLKPYAERAAKVLGVTPSLLLAQAALETGWGQKVVKNQRGTSHNLFNIKADSSWRGGKVATQTLEYHQQTPVMESASFRAYGSYAESFADYVRFLNDNPRYAQALSTRDSDAQFIHSIHQAGYATDPLYVDKVLRVQAQIDTM
ncbi:flagellar assembly peptidoglycan hydrolase FlgJ [Vibrio sp. SM6]|uniref:Peptidoglycan hydrolase FlgJ n=1 Tax=Vibrio agarilyticus TaxID=2726741 RepID=A0A7X8YFR6_9VIBR|nr:flagellar assembly peptidoglycan hydrolase FlgJ [Vibrio agarilyticus]NLS11621.1 flagellar assembly peptidoglycan hydrolase FlgJ [Vibrio agarilyticus]